MSPCAANIRPPTAQGEPGQLRQGDGMRAGWRRKSGPVWGKGPAGVSAAEGGDIDWSLLGLLLSLERCTPTVIYGSDLTAFSFAMAEAGGTIVALNPEYERPDPPETQQTRPALPNVLRMCGGSSEHLPFRDGSVGAMVTKLVGRSRRRAGEELARVERRLFTEACRVLKPGGMMCLVVDQRQGHLNSSQSRALLRRCGFSRGETYLAFPGRHRFTALAQVGAGRKMCSCIDKFVEGNAFRERWKRIWLKLLAMLGFLRYVTSDYVVFVWKDV